MNFFYRISSSERFFCRRIFQRKGRKNLFVPTKESKFIASRQIFKYVKFLVVLWLQFPLKLSQHQHHHDKTAADHLGLNYVTERILASVLPHRVQSQQQQKRDNELAADGPHIGDAPQLDESPQDIYEQELISMLEQKHGKVNTKRQSINRLLLFFFSGESERYFQFGYFFFALPESFNVFN